MIGEKIYKDNYDAHHYADLAVWCNANNAMIVDKGEYWEVVAIPPPSEAEIIAQKVAECHQYLTSTDYIGARIAEGSATVEHYADVIAKRAEAREYISEHENKEEA